MHFFQGKDKHAVCRNVNVQTERFNATQSIQQRQHVRSVCITVSVQPWTLSLEKQIDDLTSAVSYTYARLPARAKLMNKQLWRAIRTTFPRIDA